MFLCRVADPGEGSLLGVDECFDQLRRPDCAGYKLSPQNCCFLHLDRPDCALLDGLFYGRRHDI